MTEDSLTQLTRRLVAFRDDRDWRQFHTLKNLLLSVSLEAAELLELAQWKSDEDLDASMHDPVMRERLSEECADVLLYLLLVAERAGIDLGAAAHTKIDRNGEKYPVHKARGSATKYTDL